MTRRTPSAVCAIALVVAAWAASGGQTAAQAPATKEDFSRVPGPTWTVVKAESVFYSSARLEALRSWLKTLDTKAMLIAVHGCRWRSWRAVNHPIGAELVRCLPWVGDFPPASTVRPKPMRAGDARPWRDSCLLSRPEVSLS
jgi:hypothetical protein